MTFRLVIVAGCLAAAVVAMSLYLLLGEPFARSAALQDARATGTFCAKDIGPEGAEKMVEEIHARGGSWAEAVRTFRKETNCALFK